MTNSPEERIARKVIRALKAAGKPVTQVYDREEYYKVSNEKEAMENLFAVDEGFLITEEGSWVFIVNGNEWDALTNYTTDLEDILDPISEWAGNHS